MAEITVRFFAGLADAAGVAQQVVDIDPPTVGELRAALLVDRDEAFARALAVCAFLVGDDLTRENDFPLRDRVDVLPPFAGG